MLSLYINSWRTDILTGNSLFICSSSLIVLAIFGSFQCIYLIYILLSAYLSILGFYIILLFRRFYFFIFRERGRKGERKGKKHQCVAASHTPPTGDLVHNPGMCFDWELNRRPFGSQASTQSTEPHQPGRVFNITLNGTILSLIFHVFIC